MFLPPMPHLTAIVAMTPDRVIGKGGRLPWHLPEDLAFFKRRTAGHPVVMGRKTHVSIGRPLPGRRNIVLTRTAEADFGPRIDVIRHPDELEALPDLGGRVFIIGGAEVYQAFSDRIDEWLVSHVSGRYDGDTLLAPFEDRFPHSETVETHAEFEVRRHFK